MTTTAQEEQATYEVTNGNGDLRSWLDAQELQEETISVRGREFLLVEISLAERGKLIAEHAPGGRLPDGYVEALMLARCVLDPATRKQIVECDEWKYWAKKGAGFNVLSEAVLRLNGFRAERIEDAVKK